MTINDSDYFTFALQYADIERWMFNGIGTTTYTLNSKGQMTLWSQEVCMLIQMFLRH